MEARKLYLQPGDRVLHRHRPQWGQGEVLEIWTSRVPGGGCFVRIAFQDGKKRIFDNDFDSANCCYRAGLRILSTP